MNKSILVTVNTEPATPAEPIYMLGVDAALYSEEITPYNETTKQLDISAVVTGKTSGATAALAGGHSSGPTLSIKNITGTFAVGEEINVAGKTAKVVSCNIKPSQVRVDLIKVYTDTPTESLIVGHAKDYPNPYAQVFNVTEGDYKISCYNVYEGWGNSVIGDAIVGTISVDAGGVITSNLPSGMTIGDPPIEDNPIV